MSDTFILFFNFFFQIFWAEKVPSADQIEDYNDPLLKEIFASTRPPSSGPVPESLSGNNRPSSSSSSSFPSGYGNTEGGGPPPYSQSGYGSQVGSSNSYNANPNPTGGYYNQGAGNGDGMGQIGQLAVAGAQSFYQGVQTAGRIFGIQTNQYPQYEIPLVSSAANYFGRKR